MAILFRMRSNAPRKAAELSSADDRPKLAQFVRDYVASLNIGQEHFARVLKLTNANLRVRLRRNSFSLQEVNEIARLAGTTAKELLASHQVNLAARSRRAETVPPSLAAELIRAKINSRIKVSDTPLLHDVRELYSKLGPQDLAVIASVNEAPLEATTAGWQELGDTIRSAVESGTHFVYLRPTIELVKTLVDSGLSEFLNPSLIDDQQRRITARLEESGVSRAKIKQQVRLVRLNSCPFWLWNSRVGLYSFYWPERRREHAMFVRYPSAIDSDGDRDLLLETGRVTRDAFCAFLKSLFDSEDMAEQSRRLY